MYCLENVKHFTKKHALPYLYFNYLFAIDSLILLHFFFFFSLSCYRIPKPLREKNLPKKRLNLVSANWEKNFKFINMCNLLNLYERKPKTLFYICVNIRSCACWSAQINRGNWRETAQLLSCVAHFPLLGLQREKL